MPVSINTLDINCNLATKQQESRNHIIHTQIDAMATGIAVFVALLVCSFRLGYALSLNYYEKTCPDAEFIISKAVEEAFMNDKTVPAAVLRMHFHDCFIRVLY